MERKEERERARENDRPDRSSSTATYYRHGPRPQLPTTRGSHRARPQSAVTRSSTNAHAHAQASGRGSQRRGFAGDESGRRSYSGGRPRSRSRTKMSRPQSASARLFQRFAATDRHVMRGRKAVPTSSREHLRRAASKRRLKAQQFAEQLALEERERVRRIDTSVDEANKWAVALGIKKKYSHTATDIGESTIAVHDGSGDLVVNMSSQMFMREHRKLHKQQQQRRQAAGSASSRRRAGSASRGSRGAGGDAAKQRNRAHVEKELLSILRNTDELTRVLESQLQMLDQHGWNATHFPM